MSGRAGGAQFWSNAARIQLHRGLPPGAAFDMSPIGGSSHFIRVKSSFNICAILSVSKMIGITYPLIWVSVIFGPIG
jgi:hypothetical protein